MNGEGEVPVRKYLSHVLQGLGARRSARQAVHVHKLSLRALRAKPRNERRDLSALACASFLCVQLSASSCPCVGGSVHPGLFSQRRKVVVLLPV